MPYRHAAGGRDPGRPGAPVLLITGASGYIGTRLVDQALAAGFQVVAAVRDPLRSRFPASVDVVAFDLESPGQAVAAAMERAGAVIHLAAALGRHRHAGPVPGDLNLHGTRVLLEMARQARVPRFVFASSQSAAAGAATRYGRSKWGIEQMLDRPGEFTARMGMVSGGPLRGVYGRLTRMLRSRRWIPLFRGAAGVHPVHLDDVCEQLLKLAQAPASAPACILVGSRRPISFRRYLRLICHARLGRSVRLVPLPAWLGRLACWAGERTSLLGESQAERLRGLLDLRPFPDRPDPRMAWAAVPSLEPRLVAEGRRRRLIKEGLVLASYVLGGRPPDGVLRRYARVLEREDGWPLSLPGFLAAWPRLMRLLEPLPGADESLRERLILATRIAEATPVAAPLFHSYRARSLVVSLLNLAGIVLAEALILPLRLVGGRTRRAP